MVLGLTPTCIEKFTRILFHEIKSKIPPFRCEFAKEQILQEVFVSAFSNNILIDFRNGFSARQDYMKWSVESGVLNSHLIMIICINKTVRKDFSCSNFVQLTFNCFPIWFWTRPDFQLECLLEFKRRSYFSNRVEAEILKNCKISVNLENLVIWWIGSNKCQN